MAEAVEQTPLIGEELPSWWKRLWRICVAHWLPLVFGVLSLGATVAAIASYFPIEADTKISNFLLAVAPVAIITFVVSAYKYIRKTYDKWRGKNPGDCVCCRCCSKWICCSSDSDDEEHEGEEEEDEKDDDEDEKDDDEDEEHGAGSQRWYRCCCTTSGTSSDAAKDKERESAESNLDDEESKVPRTPSTDADEMSGGEGTTQ